MALRIPLDPDVFNYKMLAIQGLIISTIIAIIKKAKTFHFISTAYGFIMLVHRLIAFTICILKYHTFVVSCGL